MAATLEENSDIFGTTKEVTCRKRRRAVLQTTPNVDNDLLCVIDRVMMLEQQLIDLGDRINSWMTRLQLLVIFMRVALAITFNAYNLVLFCANLAFGVNRLQWSVGKALIFYGYHILSPAFELLFTVMAFSWTYDEIAKAARLANQLNIYALDERLRSRLCQFVLHVQMNLRRYTVFGLYNLDGSLIYAILSGTTTYIVILLQYGLENDLAADTPLMAMANRTLSAAND